MTADPSDDHLTHDAFLGGLVSAWQPRNGYRAATDPVFLAACVPARTGQTILELGCGVGVASLCLAARVPGLVMTGVELQSDYAALARRNARHNGAALEVVTTDLTELPAELRMRRFDHVIANPPYYDPAAPAARDPGRDLALREATPLAVWVDVALRRARDRGYITMIHLAERLPELLAAFGARASLEVLPLASRAGQQAHRVVVKARKGGRSPFRLLPPMVIHRGDRHPGDEEHFTDEVRAIMRGAGALALC